MKLTSDTQLAITELGLEQFVRSAQIGKVTVCPACSSGRSPQNKSKKVFRVYQNEDSLGFNCMHCGLTGLVGVDKTPYEPKAVQSDIHPNVVAYFAGRGISPSTLQAAKVGGDQREIAFQYLDHHQIQRGIKYRNLAPEGSPDRKFRKEVGSQSIFYGLDGIPPGAPSVAHKLIITEGEIDRLSGLESGLHAILSLPDGSSKSGAQGKKIDIPLRHAADLLAKFKGYILAIEDDEAGNRMKEELADRLGKHKCWLVKWPEGCKDMNAVLTRKGPEAVRKLIEDTEPYPIEGIGFFSEEEDLIYSVFKNGFPVIPGLGMGDKFDNAIKFIRGQWGLFTGIPNHGKTHFCLFLMLLLSVKRGWKWAVFSPEQESPGNIEGERMPRNIFLFQELAEMLIGKNFWKEVSTILGDRPKTVERMNEWELKDAFSFIEDHFILIKAKIGKDTLQTLFDRVDYLKLKCGVSGFLWDPWNKIDGAMGLDNAGLAGVLKNIDSFVISRELCGFITAHPVKMKGKEVELSGGKSIIVYDPPTAYDIKGGGEFHDMAPNIFTVYRDFRNNKTIWINRKVKHRLLGTPGIEVLFTFDLVNGRYIPEGEEANYDSLIQSKAELLNIPF